MITKRGEGALASSLTTMQLHQTLHTESFVASHTPPTAPIPPLIQPNSLPTVPPNPPKPPTPPKPFLLLQVMMLNFGGLLSVRDDIGVQRHAGRFRPCAPATITRAANEHSDACD